ncbi:MAG: nucleotidyltransferase domain-containing protein [Magnetococcales bacterium]|nr:nucleotidyltransferase domain-containing protein [Magnetococcales bacterium]
MTADDRRVLSELKDRLTVAASHTLRKLVVFGSRVRGDHAEDSDLDVVALVERATPAVIQKMDDAAYDVMWKFDFRPMISLKIFEVEWFDAAVRNRIPFYRNVVREGVVLGEPW